MSLFGIGHTSYSLKDLLENPILQNPPQLNKDVSDLKKKEKGSLSPTFDPTSAFLGPNIWSTSDYTDNDISLEYMDLDEFLSENGIPVDLNEVSNGSSKSSKSVSAETTSKVEADSTLSTVDVQSLASETPSSPSPSEGKVELKKEEHENERVSPVNVNVDYKITEQEVALATIPVPQPEQDDESVDIDFDIDDNEQDLVNAPGEEIFDPKSRKFSEDELKPQPMIKKSRKVFVPDEQKDDKYWSRRKKNNVAAKRSRDARRVKENQIAMRAAYLEKCNQTLTEEVQKLKKENATLKKSLDEANQKLNS